MWGTDQSIHNFDEIWMTLCHFVTKVKSGRKTANIMTKKLRSFITVKALFNDTYKAAKISWFLLVLHWAIDVIYDFITSTAQWSTRKNQNDFCCFRCVMNNGLSLTAIKLLRFFVLNYVYSDVKPTYPGWPQNTTVSLTFIIT